MKDYAFGIDIGGTTVKIGFFETSGTLVKSWEIPTRTEENGKYILSDIAAAIDQEISGRGLSKNDIEGIGIDVPGPVLEDRIVNRCANLGWGILDVAEEMTKLTGIEKIGVANDANAATLGEMWQGGGKGYSNMVAVTLGTGVGGGIIVNGKILTGATGAGGEIGHIHLEDNETESCGCKKKGCLEQYASATGIVRLANRRLAKDDAPSALRGGEVSAKTVFDAVKAGDAVAIEIAEQFGDYLGKGLAAVAAVVNPEVFVIGGGVSKAGEILLSYVKPAFAKYVFYPCGKAEFKLATLGNDAGIFGAAALILK